MSSIKRNFSPSLYYTDFVTDPGEINDSIQIKVSHDGNESARASENRLSTDGGNDSLTLDLRGISNSSAQADRNTFEGGSGNDKMTLKAVAVGGNSSLKFNDFIATGDKNQVRIDASSRMGEATISENEVDIEGGSIRINATGGSGMVKAVDNAIYGEVSSTKMDIKLKHRGSDANDDYAEFRANTIGGSAENDSVKLSVSGALEELRHTSNEIDLGEGDDRLEIKLMLKGGDDGELIDSSNTFLGGQGDDSIKVQLTSDHEISLDELELDSGKGDDKIQFKLKASDRLLIENNEFELGNGNDQFLLQSQTQSQLNRFQENTLKAQGNIDDDKDIDILLKGKGDVTAVRNQIDILGDEINLNIQTKSSKGVSEIRQNYIYGLREDTIDLSATGGTDAVISFNEVLTYDGHDQISLFAKGPSSRIVSNIIDAEADDDQVSVSSKGDMTDFGSNLINLGSENDSLTIDVKSKLEARVTKNTIYGGEGDDSIEIKIQSKGDAYVTDNVIEAGDGNDYIDIEVANDRSTPLGGNLFKGDGGRDTFSLDLAKRETGNEFADFLGSNSIDGGLDHDVIEIRDRGQKIDFGNIADDALTDIEELHFARGAMVDLNADDVIAMTDAANLLFVTGRGTELGLDDGWAALGESLDYAGFDVFQNMGATVLVEAGVDVV